MKCCPTCKRPFAPDVQVGGKRRQAFYDYIARNPQGVTRYQILDHVYADDPDGGPNGHNIVCVTIKHINAKLEKHGHRIRIRGSGGPGSIYKVVGL